MNPGPEHDDMRMPLWGHIQEFRWRVIVCLIAIGAASIAAYTCMDDLLAVIAAPVGHLYFLQPAEVFFTYIRIAVFTGFIVSLPLVAYQAWAFLRPALTRREIHVSIIFFPACLLLFYGGLTFSYFFVLPAAVRFFIDFSTQELQPMFSLSSYFSFFVSFELPFALAFELPLVLLLLSRAGLITPVSLRRKRKAFILGAFIFAAVISPTGDAFTQAMIAVPMVVLYEGSILLMSLVRNRHKDS